MIGIVILSLSKDLLLHSSFFILHFISLASLKTSLILTLKYSLHYFAMAMMSVASDTMELTTENQMVVLLLMADVRALVLLGVT